MQVFISYARETSARDAEALHAALGDGSFLDRSGISPGETFPARLADALLASRVMVVLADEAYFQRWYCGWELDAALGPYAVALAAQRDPAPYLDHLVVALPRGAPLRQLERFPPELRTACWESREDVSAVAELVRRRLSGSVPSLREAYAALGQPPALIRDRLVERSANRYLSAPTGKSDPSASCIPPSLGERFVGRARDLWRLDYALGALRPNAEGPAPTVLIEGPGGTGKTRLALEYLHRLGPSRFPGGVFWIDAGEDLESQHHRILKALEPDVPELPVFQQERRDAARSLAAALRKRASAARVLFIIDDVPETPPGAQPSPLSRWCPAMGSVAVLATSRTRLGPGERAASIALGGLDPPAAIQMLAGGMEATAPLEAYQVIADWVGGLPLALALLGAALELGSISVGELARQVAAPEGQAALLDAQMEAIRPHVPAGSLRGVTEALSVSYRRLEPAAQHAAGLIALFASAPLPVELLEELEIAPSTRATLVARSFVGKLSGGGAGGEASQRFGPMHQVLADFVRSAAPAYAEDLAKVYQAIAVAVDRAMKAQRWRELLGLAPHVLHVLRTRQTLAGRDEVSEMLADAVTFSMAQLARREQSPSELPSYLSVLSRYERVQAACACDLDQIERFTARSSEIRKGVEFLLNVTATLLRGCECACAPFATERQLAALVEATRPLTGRFMKLVPPPRGALREPGSDRGPIQARAKRLVVLFEGVDRLRASLDLLGGELQAGEHPVRSETRQVVQSLMGTAREVREAATAVRDALEVLERVTLSAACAASENAATMQGIQFSRQAMAASADVRSPDPRRLEARRHQLEAGVEQMSTALAEMARIFNEMSSQLADLGMFEESMAAIRVAADVGRHLWPGASPGGSVYRQAHRQLLRDLGEPDGDASAPTLGCAEESSHRPPT